MQQSSATPKNHDVGRGLQTIVACSQSSSQRLLVSIVFGTVSSLHPIARLWGYCPCAMRTKWRPGHPETPVELSVSLFDSLASLFVAKDQARLVLESIGV